MIFGDVAAHPDAADFHVVAFDVAAEFVVSVKALRLVIAEGAEGGLTMHLHAWLAGNLSFVSYGAVLCYDRDGLSFGGVTRRAVI